IFRSTTLDGTYTKLNSGLLASSIFSDTSVQEGVSYYYQVRAVDTSANASNPVIATGTYVAPAVTDSVTLNPSADASVRDGVNGNKTYGTLGTLEVKKDGRDNYRETYLTFDLTSLTGDIANATLRL